MERMKRSGVFITFEGPDGSGKTTQAQLLTQWLQSQGVPVLYTREPGGTRAGERIRELVLNADCVALSPMTEVLLMAADRAQHVDELIRPSLLAGKWVICDRYVDSSIVYQGYALGVDVEKVKQINRIATGDLKPDLTIVLDIDPKRGLKQVSRREQGRKGRAGDKIERRGEAFQQRVRTGYRELAGEDSDRIVFINATELEMDRVQSEIRKVLKERTMLPEGGTSH